jgi:CubicO group peptidase (beta-lactamase class C family)
VASEEVPVGVTPATWQQPPHQRWAFWHVREVLPTLKVAAAEGVAAPLPPHRHDLDLRAVTLGEDTGDTPRTVGDVLDGTDTDAFVVLQDGGLAAEWYDPADGGGPDRTHAVMSVTKSVVGCVAATLVEDGLLALDDPVERHVPELAAGAWAGCTVRSLLDMRSGATFVEDYTDPTADIRRLDRWVVEGPNPADGDGQGLYAFLTTVVAGGPHGGRFLYRSAESDVLGWVCERAAGRRMADLVTERIWQPIGAETDADLICDPLGTAIHDGGLAATARDLARFGRLLLDGGTVPGPDGPVAVLPPRWLRDAWTVDADLRTAFLASPAEVSFPGGWYRNQFWIRPGTHGDVLLCLGIHGQLVHINRRTRTVCVKLSSWPTAQDPRRMQETLLACDAIGAALAGLPAHTDRHRLPGVVSGLSRGRDGRHRGSAV